MVLKLSQLRNFKAVVEAGAVRQAAKILNLSQSSITKSIQQLEDELGVVLLERGAKGVAATEAGKAVIARIKSIESELRHARNDVEAIQGAGVGEIRVSASPSVATGLLPSAVIAFQRKHPRVSLRILEGVYPDMLPAIRIGDLDLAVCLVPEKPRDDTLRFVTLVRDRLVPAVRRDHPLLKRRKLKLAELTDQPWIVYRRGRTGLDVFEQTFVANGLQPPKVAIECTSFACALALVEKGDYVTLVPSQVFAGRAAPALAPVLLDAPMQPWEVVAISRVGRDMSAVCGAFLEELTRAAAKIDAAVGGRRVGRR